MSGYHISVEDRLLQKPSLGKKKNQRHSDTPQDAIAVFGSAVFHRSGLPESKYVCVRKQYTKIDAQEELWGLQREHGRKNRWVMEECFKCKAWHIIRMEW